MVVCSEAIRPAEGADVPFGLRFWFPVPSPFELTAVLDAELGYADRLALTSPPI